MKLFTRPKCFSEAIALMTSLNCLLGLRAFEYPRGYSRPILSLIYLLFICSIYSYSSLYCERKYNANAALMKLEYILYEILMYITIASVILKMLFGWWHTKVFTNEFKLINQLLCEKLTNLSTKEIKLGIFELKDYAKIMKVGQRKHIFSKNLMFQLRRRKQSRMNVFVSEESENRVVSQIGTEFIPPQFKKQLQSKFRNPSQKHSATIAKSQERKYLLQIIKQVHLELCKITKMVCTILGVQMAWEIGEIIVVLTVSLYYFYIRYTTQQYNVLLELTIWSLVLSFLGILKAIYLSYVSKSAANEANETIEIIHAIYGCDADMQEEIQQFGIQILQSPVTFFVFGVTLDNRILSSILKTVSTYIVIMIQMSHALESNNDV